MPVSAFIANDIDTQRDQFLRVNSTKPLPRGLISEALPDASTILPANLAARDSLPMPVWSARLDLTLPPA